LQWLGEYRLLPRSGASFVELFLVPEADGTTSITLRFYVGTASYGMVERSLRRHSDMSELLADDDPRKRLFDQLALVRNVSHEFTISMPDPRSDETSFDTLHRGFLTM
jgi:hypothetical protein